VLQGLVLVLPPGQSLVIRVAPSPVLSVRSWFWKYAYWTFYLWVWSRGFFPHICLLLISWFYLMSGTVKMWSRGFFPRICLPLISWFYLMSGTLFNRWGYSCLQGWEKKFDWKCGGSLSKMYVSSLNSFKELFKVNWEAQWLSSSGNYILFKSSC